MQYITYCQGCTSAIANRYKQYCSASLQTFAPELPCHIICMSDPGFMHERYRYFIAGMMINKANFFLCSFGFGISVIISAPDGIHFQIFKTAAQKLFRSFRLISQVPASLRSAPASRFRGNRSLWGCVRIQ